MLFKIKNELFVFEFFADPLYWDSFKLAGDDLLKEIIQQIIIEGTVYSDADEGCTGVIENYAKSKVCIRTRRQHYSFDRLSGRNCRFNFSVYRKGE